MASVFDYLPAGTTLALHHDVSGAIQDFWRDATSRYKMAGGDPDRPLLQPAQLFVPAEEFYVRAQAFARIDLLDKPEEEAREQLVDAAALPPLAVDRRAQDPLTGLKRFLETSGLRVLIAAESPGRRETMANYLAEYGVKLPPCTSFEEFQSSKAPAALCVSPLSHGFALSAEGWAVVTEAELYAGVVRRRRMRGTCLYRLADDTPRRMYDLTRVTLFPATAGSDWSPR